MSPEWVTAAASGATLVVVAIAAFAALRQMGHMRSGNQVALFTSYNTEWDSPEFSKAFAFARALSVEDVDDQTLRDLAMGKYSGDFYAIRLMANFFEDIGAFVRTGILSKDIVCTLYGGNVRDLWRSLSPFVALMRDARNDPTIWEHFEYLALESEVFIAAHPDGAFPEGARRMPLDDSLLERYRKML